jgi:protein CWC15
MTTAHRPTWKAAVAKESGGWSAGGAISTQRSALDAPAHTQLKFRPDLIHEKEQVIQKSLRELEQAQKKQQQFKVTSKRSRQEEDELKQRAERKLLTHTKDVNVEEIRAKYNDSDVEDNNSESSSDLDEESDLDNSDSDEDDSDEDDEAALQAELAKIRAEREAAKTKEEQEIRQAEEERQQEAALMGNPLLNLDAAVSTQKKRKWNEESVFRNQAKDEPKLQKRFINDTVRNDFHKRFLNKFIR